MISSLRVESRVLTGQMTMGSGEIRFVTPASTKLLLPSSALAKLPSTWPDAGPQAASVEPGKWHHGVRICKHKAQAGGATRNTMAAQAKRPVTLELSSISKQNKIFLQENLYLLAWLRLCIDLLLILPSIVGCKIAGLIKFEPDLFVCNPRHIIRLAPPCQEQTQSHMNHQNQMGCIHAKWMHDCPKLAIQSNQDIFRKITPLPLQMIHWQSL